MRKLLATCCLVLIAGAAFADDLASELANCRVIADDAERLACYEAIGRVVEALPAAPAESVPKAPAAEGAATADEPAPAPAEPAPAAEPTPALAPKPEPAAAPVPTQASAPAAAPVTEVMPAPEDTFGKSAGEIRREQEARFGQEEITQIEATVVDLRKMGNYKLEITLDNGQKWHQISSSYLRLKEGDNIIIKRAALDSYRLLKVGNNRAMQVRRAE